MKSEARIWMLSIMIGTIAACMLMRYRQPEPPAPRYASDPEVAALWTAPTRPDTIARYDPARRQMVISDRFPVDGLVCIDGACGLVQEWAAVATPAMRSSPMAEAAR